MTTPLSIVGAIKDRRILGGHPAYQAGLRTFARWLTVHAIIYGLALSPAEQRFFCEISGRQSYNPPAGGWPMVALVAPRQIGKSLAASTWVAYEAVRSGPRGTWAILCAQDSKGASRALLSTVKDFFREGLLAGEVRNETADTLELDACTVAVWPTRPAALRGVRARIVVIDEADWLGTENGADITRQMIQAARPTLATTGGKLILISSPGRSGSTFHQTFTAAWGVDDPHVLALRLPLAMNPTLPENYIKGMRAGDSAACAAELDALWVDSDSGAYDPQAVARCIVSGRGDLPADAVADRRTLCAIDSAAGSKNGDSFAAVWGYRESGRVVVVAARRFPAPFDPASVVADIAALCRAYRVRRVVGDRFGGNLIGQLFRNERLEFETCSLVGSDALLELAPVFTTGAIELPDPTASTTAAELAEDLRAIVKRPGGGRDRADAPRNSRGHCDLASALGLLVAGLPPERKPRPRVAPLLVRGGQPWMPANTNRSGLVYASLYDEEY